MKVMVVDDEESLRTLLCDNLGFADIDTIQAGTGNEAIQLAFKERPDLAVVDIGLPDITGWKVCERLRQDSRTASMPLVILSGSVGKDVDALAKNYGVQHWVSKPYDCATLVELVKHTLASRKKS